MAYGLPTPLLAPSQRCDTEFFGRLFDQLANAHAALIKVCRTQQGAKNFASGLRKELPEQLYAVGIKQNPDDPRPDEWLVLAYNRITKTMATPPWMDRPDTNASWVDVKEAGKILGITPGQVGKLIDRFEVAHIVRGGRRMRLIQRNDLIELANRPGRWKRHANGTRTP